MFGRITYPSSYPAHDIIVLSFTDALWKENWPHLEDQDAFCGIFGPVEKSSVDFDPDFLYYAENDEAKYSVYQGYICLPGKAFESFRKICVETLASNRPIGISLTAILQGVSLKVTSVSVNRSPWEFGKPSSGYMHGNPNEWVKRHSRDNKSNVLVGVSIKKFQFKIGFPSSRLDIRFSGMASTNPHQKECLSINEARCGIRLLEWHPERWGYGIEYIQRALTYGYVGTFEFEMSPREDEGIPESLSLDIFCTRAAAADRILTALSAITEEQAITLQATLIPAAPNDPIWAEDAPEHPHGMVAQWDIEIVKKTLSYGSPCLALWCFSPSWCIKEEKCQSGNTTLPAGLRRDIIRY